MVEEREGEREREREREGSWRGWRPEAESTKRIEVNGGERASVR
jgi:hypothetical protein